MQIEIRYHSHLPDGKLEGSSGKSPGIRQALSDVVGGNLQQFQPTARLPLKHLPNFKRHILSTGIPPANICVFTYLYKV